MQQNNKNHLNSYLPMFLFEFPQAKGWAVISNNCSTIRMKTSLKKKTVKNKWKNNSWIKWKNFFGINLEIAIWLCALEQFWSLQVCI